MQRNYTSFVMRYSVKAAAMATGVSESRLRTWERRYGIPWPARSSSGRRLYEEEDLALIRRMAALVSAGVPASEAARAVQTEEQAVLPTEVAAEEHPLVGRVLEAAAAYDEAALVAALYEMRASLGWGDAFDQVLFPAFRRVGASWGDGSIITAVEHFASEIARREVLVAVARTAPASRESPSTLLACPEDERHDLGLAALWLLLRQRGLRVFYLGADVPTVDLFAAVQQVGPDAVCLSAASAGGLAMLGLAARAFVSARLPARLYVGGPLLTVQGEAQAVPGIHLPQSLPAAANMIAGTLRNNREVPA